LDNSYPNKAIVTEIKRKHFSERISGELVIENFPNLEKIDLSVIREGKLTKLKIINCFRLRKLNCRNNKLEKLDIDRISCHQLRKLDCGYNKLNFLEFNLMNSDELGYLDISENNFSSQILSDLKRLAKAKIFAKGNSNLDNLNIKYKEEDEKEIFNKENNFSNENSSLSEEKLINAQW